MMHMEAYNPSFNSNTVGGSLMYSPMMSSEEQYSPDPCGVQYSTIQYNEYNYNDNIMPHHYNDNASLSPYCPTDLSTNDTTTTTNNLHHNHHSNINNDLNTVSNNDIDDDIITVSSSTSSLHSSQSSMLSDITSFSSMSLSEDPSSPSSSVFSSCSSPLSNPFLNMKPPKSNSSSSSSAVNRRKSAPTKSSNPKLPLDSRKASHQHTLQSSTTSPSLPTPRKDSFVYDVQLESDNVLLFVPDLDLVKSHLMFAVREEVDVLKERIGELKDRINHLEYENTVLRQYATQEALQQLQHPPSNNTQ